MKTKTILGKVYIVVRDVTIPLDRAKKLFALVFPTYIKSFQTDDTIRDGFNRFVEENRYAFEMEEEINVRVFYLLVNYVFPKWAKPRRFLIKIHTEHEWELKLKEYDYKCAYCKTPSPRLQKDHVIPVSKGGSDEISNIVPACSYCNASKGNRDYPKPRTVTTVTL